MTDSRLMTICTVHARCLENPQKLREMVEKSGAHSTDLQSPESAEHLCAKCDRYAENWKPVAEEMWKEDQERKAAKKGC